MILKRGFYERSTLAVAQELLGKVLVRLSGDGVRMSGRIVETEAYLGQEDLASHASRKSSARARIMWGLPGKAYVYIVYGMHFCLNAVTETEGKAGAVLIRAIAPLEGIQLMEEKRRMRCKPRGFTDGPGKLCRALDIGIGLNGADLTSGELVIEDRSLSAGRIVAGPRVGVAYAGEWARKPWRFLEVRPQRRAR